MMSCIPDPEERRRNATDLEVLNSARAGEQWAVSELGCRELPEAMAILSAMARREAPTSLHLSERFPILKAAWAAKVAMVRRGDRTYLPEVVAGLSSSDIEKVALSIRALGEIGNRKAAFYLGPFLEDSRRIPGTQGGILCDWAGYALSRLFPDVGARLQAGLLSKHVGGAAWIPWWKENRDVFSEGL